jgi:tetratricopeptide (TPR) repeat protein
MDRRSGAVRVSVAAELPVAYAGLRTLLGTLLHETQAPVAELAAGFQREWHVLFPESSVASDDLWAVALTPSERRLHRESEQVFRVLNAAAAALVRCLARCERPVVLEGAGRCDLVSLRGVMRAVERSRLEGAGEIVLCDWADRAPWALGPERERLRSRIGPVSVEDSLAGQAPAPAPADDREGRLLALAVNAGADPTERMAALLEALRSCFFTTNYEGMLLAIDVGERMLASGAELDLDRMHAEIDRLTAGTATSAALEMEPAVLRTRHEVAAFLWKLRGAVDTFRGDHAGAFASFGRMLEEGPSPELRSQARLYRSLMLTKRLRQPEAGQAEAEIGLSELQGNSDGIRRERGWLYNVAALAYFDRGRIREAFDLERQALACVAGLSDPSSTHLKINLISNISVLQETAGRHGDALATWRRFTNESTEWDESFRKHHAYRAGGLALAMGDAAEAREQLEISLDSARAIDDHFHAQAIAAELGGMLLADGERAAAVAAYERAAELAPAVGDPLALAVSRAGRDVAAGRPPAAETADLARLSITYPDRAGALAAAVEAGGDEALRRLLPLPRTKLNRPFDLVTV